MRIPLGHHPIYWFCRLKALSTSMQICDSRHSYASSLNKNRYIESARDVLQRKSSTECSWQFVWTAPRGTEKSTLDRTFYAIFVATRHKRLVYPVVYWTLPRWKVRSLEVVTTNYPPTSEESNIVLLRRPICSDWSQHVLHEQYTEASCHHVTYNLSKFCWS